MSRSVLVAASYPTGSDIVCPRCDWLYKQLVADSFCLRCWHTHVNVAMSYIELIKFEVYL